MFAHLDYYIIISIFTAALETYHVYVTTGNVSGAGTDANVWITLFGENDDTGRLKIHKFTLYFKQFNKHNNTIQ